jgi:Putative peptidoglycan binding domain
MKRVLLIIACTVLLLPTLSFAAFNDLTLTTDTNILVGGYTLNVSGSTAAVQSITVNAGSFSVTLASGSSLTVSSPTFQQLSSDVTSDVSNITCTGSQSSISLAYSGAGTVTNVIAPSATVCSGSGGSRGGSPPTTGGSSGMIVDSGPLAPSAAGISGATKALPQATSTTTSSNARTITGAATSETSLIFTKNRQLYDRGEDVRVLQKFFNAHGFVVAQSGPGSPGNETSIFGTNTYRTVITFQKSNGLPATGYLGPLTRALINSQTH